MERQFLLKLVVVIGLAGFFLLAGSFCYTDSGGLFSDIAFCQPEDDGPEEEEPVQARPRPDYRPGPLQNQEHTVTPSVADDGQHGDGRISMQPSTGEQTMRPSAPAQTMRPSAPAQTMRPSAPAQTMRPTAPAQTMRPTAPE